MSIEVSAECIQVSIPVAVALLAFASKDVTRPHLGIGIGGDTLCATDGHRAVQFPAPGASANARKVWSRLHVETLVKIARAHKFKVVRLAFADCETHASFPPIAQVIPDYGMEATAPVGFEPSYMGDLGLVAKACETKGVRLTSARGSLDPIGFTIGGISTGKKKYTGGNGLTAVAVIMPMNI